MGFISAAQTVSAVAALQRTSVVALAFAAFCGVAFPVTNAEAQSFCGKQKAANWDGIKADLVGTWSITHQSGYAEASGMIIPIPADSAPEIFDMALIDGDLTGYHPQAPSPLVIVPVDEPRWVANATGGKPAPAITPDDAAIAIAGCDQMQLPRVIGTSGGMVAGHRLDFTFRMIVFDTAHMWGVMDVVTVVDGNTVTAHRTVTIDKVS